MALRNNKVIVFKYYKAMLSGNDMKFPTLCYRIFIIYDIVIPAFITKRF